MSVTRNIIRSPRDRRGVVVVENAIVLPVAFLFIWALFEFGRLLLAADCLIMAAQEGARVGVTPGSTSAQVQAEANSILTNSLIGGATVVTTPAEIASLKTGEALTVTVQVPFSAITWLPVPQYLNGRVLRSSCVMLREGK